MAEDGSVIDVLGAVKVEDHGGRGVTVHEAEEGFGVGGAGLFGVLGDHGLDFVGLLAVHIETEVGGTIGVVAHGDGVAEFGRWGWADLRIKHGDDVVDVPLDSFRGRKDLVGAGGGEELGEALVDLGDEFLVGAHQREIDGDQAWEVQEIVLVIVGVEGGEAVQACDCVEVGDDDAAGESGIGTQTPDFQIAVLLFPKLQPPPET